MSLPINPFAPPLPVNVTGGTGGEAAEAANGNGPAYKGFADVIEAGQRWKDYIKGINDAFIRATDKVKYDSKPIGQIIAQPTEGPVKTVEPIIAQPPLQQYPVDTQRPRLTPVGPIPGQLLIDANGSTGRGYEGSGNIRNANYNGYYSQIGYKKRRKSWTYAPRGKIARRLR